MRKGKRIVPAVVILLLTTLLLFAQTGAEQLPVEDPEIVSFGTGAVRVRLYTDYFCGPCSRMEPKIEALLADLVRTKVISLTLVDTPVHKMTPLYAKYFLYILSADRSLKAALRSRAVLFAAAREKIEDKDLLEDYLKKNGVRFREMDPKPVFVVLSALMQEDDIKSTPTCVIVKDGKKAISSGEIDITKALKSLK